MQKLKEAAMAVLMAERRENTNIIEKKERLRHSIEEDDLSVRAAIDILRRELEDLHNMFDQVTEPMLVDSIIYEIQSVQLRYMYYLDLCRARGIVSEGFNFDKLGNKK